MAVGYIGGTTTSATTGTTLTLTYTPTVGNMLVISVKGAGSPAAAACKDNNGNWLGQNTSGGGGLCYAFTAPACTGATSYVITGLTSGVNVATLAEYSGVWGGIGYGAAGTATATSASRLCSVGGQTG